MKKTLLLLASILLLTSCDNEPLDGTQLDVETKLDVELVGGTLMSCDEESRGCTECYFIRLGAEAGSFQLNVKSNTKWTVEIFNYLETGRGEIIIPVEGLQATPLSGQNDGKVNVRYKQTILNPSLPPVHAVLSFKYFSNGFEEEKIIEISQEKTIK
ncbi:hypothetical protein D0T49_03665 [Paludibacter sp. 221]|uniref:BACON domain-containing protein n=1 Tax=Paludibacter sp. 221 TaxID=2302939 RepID=UPI0013D615DD|nr:BACON domain-containing protein [Paludibacter sp. 221]NDV46138.1 hypothetical protein [Paludibacter sp. 221]